MILHREPAPFRHLRFLRAALLIAIAVYPVSGAAQPQPAAEETTFFESIDVEIVNVDVVVTDKKGEPITGLTVDDFEVLEDGQPVVISNFFAVAGGQPTVERDLEELTPQTAAAIPEDQRLNLIVFIDNLNITSSSRNRILQALEKFLRSYVRPGDRVMVVSNNGLVSVHEQLTDDLDKVLVAIEKSSKESAIGFTAETDFRRVLDEMEGVALGGSSSDAFALDSSEQEARASLSALRLYAKARWDSANLSVRTIQQFVNSLSAIRGRKAVLYVGEGLSVNPADALYQAWDQKFGGQPNMASLTSSAAEMLEFDTSGLIAELTTHANAHRVTFYAIGGGGGVVAANSPERRGLDAQGNRFWTPALESIEINNRVASLKIMAESTGGFVGRDSTNLASLMDRMRRDFDFYYSLAYEPPHRRDGKYHRIRVRLKDPELRARHREGYRDKTTAERMEDRTHSALLLGVEDNPLEIGVEFGKDKELPNGQFQVPVIVKIPMGKIVLLPGETYHEGRLAIFLAARDAKGRMSPVQHIPVPIRIDNDKILGVLSQTGGYSLTLQLRDGEHTVAVAVRDELANIDSTVSVPFTPGRLVVEID